MKSNTPQSPEGFVVDPRRDILDPRQQIATRFPGLDPDILRVSSGRPEIAVPAGHVALMARSEAFATREAQDAEQFAPRSK